MLTRLLSTISREIQVFEQGVFRIIANQFGDGSRAVSLVPLDPQAPPVTVQHGLLEDILGDSIMLAVPKKRRCVERRRIRKYGSPNLHWKLFEEKKLVMCGHCGNPHEFDRICPSCYDKSKEINAERMKNYAFGYDLHLSEKKKDSEWYDHSLLTPKTPSNPGSAEVAPKPSYEVLVQQNEVPSALWSSRRKSPK